MSVYVFVGPSLAVEEARAEIDARFLPPAAQGDVYRAALERPVAIGIIDGYFERVPSVSHKEILWAMSQGVHVFGSASMGALRAVELAPFGMEGIGAIYEAFSRGELEDEDEVAVAHAAAEHGYRRVSEAMVDIRATLQAAELRGVVGAGTRQALERIAKNLFYPERSYPVLLAGALQAGVPHAEVEALRSFLPKGRVHQKREDALALLRHLKERVGQGLEPKRVRYHFEHTDAWEFIRKNAAPTAMGRETPTDVLEELRLQGRFPEALRGAVGRVLALDMASREGRVVKGDALAASLEAFCRAQGLTQPGSLRHWMEANDVAEDDRFFEDEAQVQWVESAFSVDAERVLADHLRSTGEYASLWARAREKQRVLAELARQEPGAPDISDEALSRWYFEEHLRRPRPTELGSYARSLGFADADSLLQALRRELNYHRGLGGSASAGAQRRPAFRE